jgi:hypothetical protein
MQFPSPVSIEWISELIGAILLGDKTKNATGISLY